MILLFLTPMQHLPTHDMRGKPGVSIFSAHDFPAKSCFICPFLAGLHEFFEKDEGFDALPPDAMRGGKKNRFAILEC